MGLTIQTTDPIGADVNIVTINGGQWWRTAHVTTVTRFAGFTGLVLGYVAGLLTMGLSVYFFGGEG